MANLLSLVAVLLLMGGADGRNCSQVTQELEQAPKNKDDGEQLFNMPSRSTQGILQPHQQYLPGSRCALYSAEIGPGCSCNWSVHLGSICRVFLASRRGFLQILTNSNGILTQLEVAAEWSAID
jgi:hypothetical protein